MDDFKLHLVSYHQPDKSQISLMNRIYENWKEVFAEVLQCAGGALDPDDFFRSDFVLAISDKENIVALGTLTFFDLRLESTLDHHYLRALNPETPDRLLEKNIHCLLSLEYLTVHPAWRKKEVSVLWAEILMGVALKIMDESPADALIGTPRIDLKVTDICRNLEAREIQQAIQKMNYPCAVVLFEKKAARTFKNPETQRYVQLLLETLLDFKIFPAHQHDKKIA